jgi:hypothetical protein
MLTVRGIDTRSLRSSYAAFSAEAKKRIVEKIVRTDAMGFVRDIIAITPPGHQGAPFVSGGKGNTAFATGLLQIKSDILKVYATPSWVYGYVMKTVNKKAAAAFYGIFQSGNRSQLNDWLFKSAPPFIASLKLGFDGGAEHQQRRSKSTGRVKGSKPTVLILPGEESKLKAYITATQEKVGMLAGGWGAAATQLKVRMPAAAKKHASGSCLAQITPNQVSYTITNTVPYSRQADVDRRTQFVLDSTKRRNRLAKRIQVEIEAELKKQFNRR